MVFGRRLTRLNVVLLWMYISIARLGRVRVWIDLICTVSVALDASKPYCFSLRPVNILCGSSIVNGMTCLT